MIYDSGNVMHQTRVYDVDTKEEIRDVMEINTSAGWIKVVERPIRATSHHHIASKRIRFDAIHAIKGAEPAPCLFHCYGRFHTGADYVPSSGLALLHRGEAVIPAGIEGWGLGRKEGDGYAIGGGSGD